MNKKGFTLVELIVVVTIIGILIGGAALSLTGHAVQARDQRRKSDLLQIKSALEFYRGDQVEGYYPTDTSVLAPTYIETLPKDPLNELVEYTYIELPAGCDNTAGNYCTSYTLMIAVEGTYDAGATTMTINPLSSDVKIQ